MQVNKILPTNYNYRTSQKQKEQNNPNFGKLLISNSVSSDVIRELVGSPEIKNLVKLYDKVGINLEAIQYLTIDDACALTRKGTHLRLVDPKIYKNYKSDYNHGARLSIDGKEDKDIVAAIKNLPKDTSIENFKLFYNEFNYPKHFKRKNERYNHSLNSQYTDRQKALKEVEAFNQTLHNGKTKRQENKPFLWEKLTNLFK